MESESAMTDELKSRLGSVFEKLGYPALVTVALGYGFYLFTSWFQAEVATPLVRRHIQFVDTTEEMMRQQRQMMQSILEVLQQNSRLLQELHKESGVGFHKREGE